MEQFTPEISIVAVDDHDVIITFDTASPHDHARAVRALRIGRDFAALGCEVAGFGDGEHSAVGDRKEYRGDITLVVTDRQGASHTHTLASPALWLPAVGKLRKSKEFRFPAPADVALALRQGLADSLGAALAGYYDKESQIDLLTRAPAAPAPAEARAYAFAPPPAAPGAGAPAWLRARPAAANQTAEQKRRNGRRIVAAALITPLLVYGLLAATGTLGKRADPIQEAVAQAMTQDPRSLQAQVDLTKETLKQMGLDPGKAGDTGCFAPQ